MSGTRRLGRGENLSPPNPLEFLNKLYRTGCAWLEANAGDKIS
jgi:hypothetical protein